MNKFNRFSEQQVGLEQKRYINRQFNFKDNYTLKMSYMWVTQLLVITTTIFMRIGYGTTFNISTTDHLYSLGYKKIITGNLQPQLFKMGFII